jgi:hypothetical protein
MATVSITVNTTKDYTKYMAASQRAENMNGLINLLSGMACGALIGNVYVSGSSTATTVAASATATLTYGSLANNVDTWVGYGVTITCVTEPQPHLTRLRASSRSRPMLRYQLPTSQLQSMPIRYLANMFTLPQPPLS